MYNVNFAGNIDITVVIFSAFVLFFIGLIVYLRREDRREGYPLEDDMTGRLEAAGGFLSAANPKTLILPHGEGTKVAPSGKRDTRPLALRPTGRAAGSPFEPTGDAMRDGVGPGSWAERAEYPDLTTHGLPKIAPLRTVPEFSIDPNDPDPRGMKVLGADGKSAGVVSDVWIDRTEYQIRDLQVEVAGAGKRVLLPMPMAIVDKWRNAVKVGAILAEHFANVPVTAKPDQVTFREEDRISAYYGGGLLYATKQRGEPIL